MPLALFAALTLAVQASSPTTAPSPRLMLKLEALRVCRSDEVKVKVPFGTQGLESPLANATIVVSDRSNQTVGIGKVKPGHFIVTASGQGFSPGRLSVLILPEGKGDCFTLQELKTHEVTVDAAQASAWTKYLEGYSKLTDKKDRDDVHRRFMKSLGGVSVAAGAAFVSCAVSVSTAAAGIGMVLVWSCVSDAVGLVAKVTGNYFLAVNEVLEVKGTLNKEEAAHIKQLIQTALAAQSVLTSVAAGKFGAKQKVFEALLSKDNALTAMNYATDLTLSDSLAATVGGAADFTKKYLYVYEALRTTVKK